MNGATKITIEVLIKSSIEKAWNAYIDTEAVKIWNHASDDWKCPKAVNDFRVGGIFSYRMESTDGKYGFDFNGKYLNIINNQLIEYIMEDNREVKVEFSKINSKVKVLVHFDAESENSIELQKNGWQAILDNYKKYVEE